MRVLTVITSIFIPLTFIAGRLRDEFCAHAGARATARLFRVSFGMLLVAVGQILYFKKRGWL